MRRVLGEFRLPPLREARAAERETTEEFAIGMQDLPHEATMHRRDRERKAPVQRVLGEVRLPPIREAHAAEHVTQEELSFDVLDMPDEITMATM